MASRRLSANFEKKALSGNEYGREWSGGWESLLKIKASADFKRSFDKDLNTGSIVDLALLKLPIHNPSFFFLLLKPFLLRFRITPQSLPNLPQLKFVRYHPYENLSM
jgi:hypothetical protein